MGNEGNASITPEIFNHTWLKTGNGNRKTEYDEADRQEGGLQVPAMTNPLTVKLIRMEMQKQVEYFQLCLSNSNTFEAFCNNWREVHKAMTSQPIRLEDVPRASIKEKMREQIKILEAEIAKLPEDYDQRSYN